MERGLAFSSRCPVLNLAELVITSGGESHLRGWLSAERKTRLAEKKKETERG